MGMPHHVERERDTTRGVGGHLQVLLRVFHHWLTIIHCMQMWKRMIWTDGFAAAAADGHK